MFLSEFKVSYGVEVCGVFMYSISTVSLSGDWRRWPDIGETIEFDNVLECLYRAEPSDRGLSKVRDLLFSVF
jgi:hypothetical protein